MGAGQNGVGSRLTVTRHCRRRETTLAAYRDRSVYRASARQTDRGRKRITISGETVIGQQLEEVLE
jgi:hypothetical protein